VFAFEPQRLVFQTLCANLALNGLTNVVCRQAALGAHPGTLRGPVLAPDVVQNFDALAPGAFTRGEDVPVETIDSLNLTGCDLIKADVEGMELDVLRGAARTIETYRPLLYVENERPELSRALLSHLLALGYVAYWHLPPYFHPSNHFGNLQNVFP